MKRKRTLAKAISAGALAAVAINMQAPTVDAADHVDSPSVSSVENASADIGDLYAWYNSTDDTIVVIMTFAGLLDAADYPVYDPDVLYSVHIDNTAMEAELLDYLGNDNDNVEDISIRVRFGQNLNEEWFAQVTDLPGTDDVLVGSVDGDIGDPGARVAVGVFDDPFFFDLEGFQDTLANIMTDDGGANDADIAFAGLAGTPGSAVDFFAGLNTMGIVMEFPAADALNGNADNVVQIWATTGRAPR